MDQLMRIFPFPHPLVLQQVDMTRATQKVLEAMYVLFSEFYIGQWTK